MKTLAILFGAGALLLAGCTTVPPPDPVTKEEIVSLAEAGPDSPALVTALETRPLGFPLDYRNLKDLEERGVPPAVLDTVVALSVDRRARSIAPRYSVYDRLYYDPWYPLYPWSFGLGFGYHVHPHR